MQDELVKVRDKHQVPGRQLKLVALAAEELPGRGTGQNRFSP